MSCARVRARFSAFLDRDLVLGEQRAVAAHVQVCLRCARELRLLEGALQSLQSLPRLPPLGLLASVVADQIELERRGPGLQLLFRPAWAARPLMARGLLNAAFLLALMLCGALALERPAAGGVATAFRAEASGGRLPALGTEANPLFPSSAVAVPQLRPGGPVIQPLIRPESEGSLFLETVVARDGSVSAVNLIGGDSAQARALAASLRRQHFEPTRVGGRPVAVSLYRLFSCLEVRARPT